MPERCDCCDIFLQSGECPFRGVLASTPYHGPRLARPVRLPFPSAYRRSLSGPAQCSCSPQPNQITALTFFAVCPIQTMQIAAVPLPWVSGTYVPSRTSHILQIRETRRCRSDIKNPQCRRLSTSNTLPYCSLYCLLQQLRRKISGASASGRLQRLLQAKAHTASGVSFAKSIIPSSPNCLHNRCIRLLGHRHWHSYLTCRTPSSSCCSSFTRIARYGNDEARQTRRIESFRSLPNISLEEQSIWTKPRKHCRHEEQLA